ncbi:MAG: peptidoglycan DD-metalloendopeptidase family protein [Pseudomonadota bacterium]|nr:peptidoglycan DD-metalloendopeptidase family protein [Pseudomonadota bacterium]
MRKIVQSLNPLEIASNLQQLKTVSLLAAVTLFAGCQIHKPVPVDYIQPGGGYAQTSEYSAPRNNPTRPNYDARQYPRKNTPSVNNPYAKSTPNPVWQPIEITPLDMTVAPPEPTQPINQYAGGNSRPQPLRPVANSAYGQDGYHVVQRGDTLYSIARRYSLNVKDVAAFNRIAYPYEIYPNQKIYLNAQGSGTAAVNNSGRGYSTPSPAKPMTTPVAPTGDIAWQWPVEGSLIGQYVQGKSNGIEIAGQPGRTIRASADGTVLYSGNQVTGYGELIIIDHGQGFMSTYAHNRRLLVKQGDQVRSGDKIAEMGSSEADRTKLHFEIRKGEKPVDPLAYLPRR